MNSTTIITGLTPLQAMELICIVYCAHHLHVPGATHRKSRTTTIPPTASTDTGAWRRMKSASCGVRSSGFGCHVSSPWPNSQNCSSITSRRSGRYTCSSVSSMTVIQ
jgi:hypothetical protein